MLKLLFEVLTGDVAVMDNVIYNYICMGIIGLIAYTIAYRMVGDAYAIGMIDGRGAGSVLHWGLRVLIFFASAYIVRGGIWLYNFIIEVPHWVWWLCAGVTLAVIASGLLLHYVKERGKVKNES